VINQLSGMLVKALPFFGYRDVSGTSLKQPHTKPFFQLSNMTAQSRLGHVQCLCRCGVSLLFNYMHEIEVVVQVNVHICVLNMERIVQILAIFIQIPS
jgi:hypothetical protein